MKNTIEKKHLSFFDFTTSFLGHLILILLFSFKIPLFSKKMDLYVPILEVDLVALPEILKKDLQPQNHQNQIKLDNEVREILKKSSSQEKKEEKKENGGFQQKTPLQKKREKNNKRALDRLKSFAKLEENLQRETQPHKRKGNKLSLGSSLSGKEQESARANYLDGLLRQLKENWILPSWLSRLSLKAQVKITLDAHGNMLQFRFIKTSQNKQFDEAVKNTLDKSNPFPPPPEGETKVFQTDGILIGFPL